MKVRAATKAELVGRLSSQWQIGMFLEDDSSVIAPSTLIPAVQQQLMALPPFESRWQIGMFLEDDSSVIAPSTLIPAVQQQLLALPPFESVKNWVKICQL